MRDAEAGPDGSKRVFEVDPLICPQCMVEMKFVAVIEDLSVVDKILAHLRGIRL